MGKRTQQHAWNEVYALILLGTGTLLFLALISYGAVIFLWKKRAKS